jgi:ABC-type transport system substrate-binding protein
MLQASYGGADPDTLRIVLGCEEFPPERNGTFYCNEDVEALFQQGIVENDPEKRAAIYEELQQIVWDDAPWIFMSDLLWIGAVSANVQDFVVIEGNQNYYDLRWVKK